MSTKIEIPLSKTKTAILLVFILAIGVAGVYAFLSPEALAADTNKSAEYFKVIGILVAGIALGLSIFIIWKFFTKKYGLIIDQNGITDISNATYNGLIEWADITGVNKVKIGPLKSILLQTDKPEKYINMAKKGNQPSMRKTYKFHGSPLMIVSSRLKIKYDELAELISSEFEKAKQISQK